MLCMITRTSAVCTAREGYVLISCACIECTVWWLLPRKFTTHVHCSCYKYHTTKINLRTWSSVRGGGLERPAGRDLVFFRLLLHARHALLQSSVTHAQRW
jgi:hypothetical protein